MKEGTQASLQLALTPETESAITIAGFVWNQEGSNLKLSKESFAPVSLKGRQPENPWAQLVSNPPAATIDESSLLKEDDKTVQKFGCADDKLTAGKPCENCTCGKKELVEGNIT